MRSVLTISVRSLVPALALLLAACGDRGPADSGQGAQREIPPGQSRIRTIVGEDLEKLPGAAGVWARQEASQREKARQAQGWLQPVDIDFGEQPVGKKVVGTFALRNPTGQDHVLRNITSSCGCQKVVVSVGDRTVPIDKKGHEPIPVPQGATGKLEAHIEVPDRQGAVVTEVRVETSDPAVPSVQLILRFVAIREFIVENEGERRDAIDLQVMTVHSQKSFEFVVRSRDGKPFTIKGHAVPPVGMKLAYEPVDDKRAVWRIKGQMGPGLSETSVGGAIHFETDRREGFDIQVFVLVQPPVRIEPAMLSFGVVPQSEGASLGLTLSAVDPADAFAVKDVEVLEVLPAGASVKCDVVPGANGETTVKVTVPPDQPRGRLAGKLRIGFGDGKYDPRIVQFLGFIR